MVLEWTHFLKTKDSIIKNSINSIRDKKYECFFWSNTLLKSHQFKFSIQIPWGWNESKIFFLKSIVSYGDRERRNNMLYKNLYYLVLPSKITLYSTIIIILFLNIGFEITTSNKTLPYLYFIIIFIILMNCNVSLLYENGIAL